jgi:hypothetical protein
VEPVNCATSDGALKMPAPMTMPTMSATASRSRSGLRLRGVVGVVHSLDNRSACSPARAGPSMGGMSPVRSALNARACPPSGRAPCRDAVPATRPRSGAGAPPRR